ncbi:MAG: hypothetical protein JNL83_26300 [Myxococcales bacterium]|nr:hypothetical protein [Myxococcales bacterium]
MTMLRIIGLSLSFAFGVLVALVVSIYIFFRSLVRGARAFHPRGSVCRAQITALDDVAGPRLAGAAEVRFASSTADENAPDPSIIGLSIKIRDRDQDLAFGTFESFAKAGKATETTNVADYLANEYASVAPWRVKGVGIAWLRLVPVPEASAPKTGLRTERLDADIAAGRATFILEARSAPNPDGPLLCQLAKVRLTERVPADDPEHRISMFRTGRGIVPTGFRNGVRAIVYPVSQLARRLRGG